MECGSDPWRSNSHTVSEVEINSHDFEDNFTVSNIKDKLPDSAQYLASLGRRLFIICCRICYNFSSNSVVETCF